jgi:hypothetical protein
MFTIIYRTGGTARFVWNATLHTGSREALAAEAARIERMGYRALIVPVGTALPATWEA